MAMLQQLFSSKVRIGILSTFFAHPDRPLYLRELERLSGKDYKNVSREVGNLESIGLLQSSRTGNLKYYRLNRDFLLYEELRSMILKTTGAAGVIKEALQNVEGAEIAFIYGSFAAATESEKSDIDLMVIGTVPMEGLLKCLRIPEQTLKREIQPSLFTRPEFEERLVTNDPFIVHVLEEPKIMLIGNKDELRETELLKKDKAKVKYD